MAAKKTAGLAESDAAMKAAYPRGAMKGAKSPLAPKKRRKKYTGPGSETAVQKDILKWLAGTPILHWRQNSGMAILGKRRIVLGEAGLPDILCVIDGLLIGLEVKGLNAAGKMGTLSKSQRAMRTKFSRAGAEYFMVTSLETAQQAIAFFVGSYTLKKEKV